VIITYIWLEPNIRLVAIATMTVEIFNYANKVFSHNFYLALVLKLRWVWSDELNLSVGRIRSDTNSVDRVGSFQWIRLDQYWSRVRLSSKTVGSG